jgi:hypothetical protein
MPTSDVGTVKLPTGMYDPLYDAQRELAQELGRTGKMSASIGDQILDADIRMEQSKFEGFINQQKSEHNEYLTSNPNYDTYRSEWDKRLKDIEIMRDQLKHNASRRWAENYMAEYKPVWEFGVNQYVRRQQVETISAESIVYMNNLVDADLTGEADKYNANFGKRNDGTEKGYGWRGILKGKTPDGLDFEATEYTVQSDAVKVDGKRIDFPTLVPTLTQEEEDLMMNDIIPNRKPVPEGIMRKAIDYANEQLKAGKSVYAPPLDENQFKEMKIKAKAQEMVDQNIWNAAQAQSYMDRSLKALDERSRDQRRETLASTVQSGIFTTTSGDIDFRSASQFIDKLTADPKERETLTDYVQAISKDMEAEKKRNKDRIAETQDQNSAVFVQRVRDYFAGKPTDEPPTYTELNELMVKGLINEAGYQEGIKALDGSGTAYDITSPIVEMEVLTKLDSGTLTADMIQKYHGKGLSTSDVAKYKKLVDTNEPDGYAKLLLNDMEAHRRAGSFIFGTETDEDNKYAELSFPEKLDNDTIFNAVNREFRMWLAAHPDATDAQKRDKYEALMTPAKQQGAVGAFMRSNWAWIPPATGFKLEYEAARKLGFFKDETTTGTDWNELVKRHNAGQSAAVTEKQLPEVYRPYWEKYKAKGMTIDDFIESVTETANAD